MRKLIPLFLLGVVIAAVSVSAQDRTAYVQRRGILRTRALRLRALVDVPFIIDGYGTVLPGSRYAFLAVNANA